MSKIENILLKILTKFQNLSGIRLVIAWISIPLAVIIAYTIITYLPKTVEFNYASQQNCYQNPLILPKTLSSKSQNFEFQYSNSLKIKDFILFSKSTCIKMVAMPDSNISTGLNLFKNRFIKQKVTILLPEAPKLTPQHLSQKPISTISDLSYKLDYPDQTFSYKVLANEKHTSCTIDSEDISCDLKPLDLTQSKQYDIRIVRDLNDKTISTVYSEKITTVEPAIVTEQSIPNKSTIYDSPHSMYLKMNKNIIDVSNYQIIDLKTNKQIINKTTAGDNKINIEFDAPLPRETTIQLKISELKTEDGSLLSSPFITEFNTSGGPKVTSSNIGNYGENINKNFVLNFDSKLEPGQNLAGLIYITYNKKRLATTAKISGKTISLSTTESIPICANFSIILESGLKSSVGITSSKPWQLNSRTLCRTAQSIGTSVQGRSIIAYRYGNGASKIIFVGATHGNEYSSKYTLDSWMNELEANPDKIPSNKTLYIIPVLNPDGFSNNTRTNANNVDLNRNFPSDNWKSEVKMPDGSILSEGGGKSPLSEPESSAFANFITSQKPSLVLTYHSKGSIVVANESGNSIDLANTYGSISGFYATKESSLGSTFDYDTTGAMENWLHDKLGIPSLLIELPDHNQNNFWQNKNAMWKMIN